MYSYSMLVLYYTVLISNYNNKCFVKRYLVTDSVLRLTSILLCASMYKYIKFKHK